MNIQLLSGLLRPLLKKFPDLANDVTTGGAQPLHNCGMSALNQESVAVLVEFGADVEALDTYGMTPLHRMVLLSVYFFFTSLFFDYTNQTE